MYYYFNVSTRMKFSVLFISNYGEQRYPNDDWRVKMLAVAVWLLDTTHQAMIVHSCYVYLIQNFANPIILNIIVRTLFVRSTFMLFVR